MAVDEMLLRQAAERGTTCLRFYLWSEPTLSLGYFQKAADRTSHSDSLSARLVRRSTGGGAILHDKEWTYSLTRPSTTRSDAESQQLYAAVHESLAEVLNQWGVEACLSTGQSGPEKQQLLCFERRAVGDVLVGPHKVLGSAQRRHNGALLQHGSLLLERSPCAPHLPGIFDLAPQITRTKPQALDLRRKDDRQDATELIRRWYEAMAHRLEVVWQSSAWRADELRAAEEIREKRFADDRWTFRR